MKRLTFAGMLLLCFIYSCVTVRAYVGMPESEFTKKYASAALVKMSPEMNVYRMTLYINGSPETRYFYFHDSKLYAVDGGVARPDLTIQVNQ